ncbi:MAG: sigma 54-interacting transcriptional regulator [Desulfobacterales bacterium]|nr:sigma 54-interacting transcriptional regulator [Desulfobacterales bacterium]
MSRVFDSTNDGIWVWDAKGFLVAINEQAETLGDIEESAVIGLHYNQLVSQGLYTKSAVPDIIAAKGDVAIQSTSMKTGITTVNTGSPSMNVQGDLARIVVRERNVTQLSQEQRHRATQDMLNPDPFANGRFQMGKDQIVVANPAYRNVLNTSLKLAKSGVSSILILGASGTGKGLLARFIHSMSPRRDKPFFQINCAAFPLDLMEAELFGYEAGAFTGARRGGKPGLLEMAKEGTLFLDEIGELPLPLQAKLLKYLDDFQFIRLGGTRVRYSNCHVIAATNRDLDKRVKQGRFREDLLFRINAFTLDIPPLRERPEDVKGLIRQMLKQYNQSYGKRRHISPATVEMLYSHPFPGNVRELKNIIKQAVILSETDAIDGMIQTILSNRGTPLPLGTQTVETPPAKLKEQMLAFERQILVDAMESHTTSRAIAAHLGIDQSNVVRKLKKHGLSLGTK